MPDWLTQSGQCRTMANLGILACRLPLFPDCPIGWCSPYYRLQSTDCFIDSIHWPDSIALDFIGWNSTLSSVHFAWPEGPGKNALTGNCSHGTARFHGLFLSRHGTARGHNPRLYHSTARHGELLLHFTGLHGRKPCGKRQHPSVLWPVKPSECMARHGRARHFTARDAFTTRLHGTARHCTEGSWIYIQRQQRSF